MVLYIHERNIVTRYVCNHATENLRRRLLNRLPNVATLYSWKKHCHSYVCNHATENSQRRLLNCLPNILYINERNIVTLYVCNHATENSWYRILIYLRALYRILRYICFILCVISMESRRKEQLRRRREQARARCASEMPEQREERLERQRWS